MATCTCSSLRPGVTLKAGETYQIRSGRKGISSRHIIDLPNMFLVSGKPVRDDRRDTAND